VPTGVPRLLAFLHPISALLSLAFLAYVASLGLRARDRSGGRLRLRHARLAPWAYGWMGLNFAGGAASTWYLRPDLALGDTAHFRFGLVVLALLGGAALLARAVGRNETARLLHPMLGLLALVLSGLQVFFGMPMLPL
jgi:hypothetical protein